jgi:hypothetical protein
VFTVCVCVYMLENYSRSRAWRSVVSQVTCRSRVYNTVHFTDAGKVVRLKTAYLSREERTFNIFCMKY